MIESLVAFFLHILEGYSAGLIEWLNSFLNQVGWLQIFKVCLFLIFTLFWIGMLILLIGRVFAFYAKRRIRKHKLTITNNGNTPSIFLLRTVDLPKTLTVRFRINGMSMILLTHQEETDEEVVSAGQPQQTQTTAQVPQQTKAAVEGPMIPNLKDPMKQPPVKPMEAVDGARKVVGQTARKLGLFRAIIGGVSTLLPIKSKKLQQIQGKFASAQKGINETTQAVNVKISSAETLKGQIGSLVPQGAQSAKTAGFASSGASAVPLTDSVVGAAGPETELSYQGNGVRNESGVRRNFSYEEDDFLKNLGKTDPDGGSLNYAQSKVLEPGESMKIDVEIMNLSETSAPVSHLYKIEVVQVPQAQIYLTAPRQYVNGIVIFPKISQLERILPPLISVGIVVVSVQLLALFSYILF